MKLRTFQTILLCFFTAFVIFASIVLLRWSKLSVGPIAPVRMNEIYTGWRA